MSKPKREEKPAEREPTAELGEETLAGKLTQEQRLRWQSFAWDFYDVPASVKVSL